MKEEWLGDVIQSKKRSLVCFVTENGQHNLLKMGSKLLLAGNAAKHTEKLRKFMFFNRNFLHKKFRK
jgi:hypothetical protein